MCCLVVPVVTCLELRMMVSRCCRHSVVVQCANDYGDHFVCERCFRECDTIFSIQLTNKEVEDAEVQSEFLF